MPLPKLPKLEKPTAKDDSAPPIVFDMPVHPSGGLSIVTVQPSDNMSHTKHVEPVVPSSMKKEKPKSKPMPPTTVKAANITPKPTVPSPLPAAEPVAAKIT